MAWYSCYENLALLWGLAAEVHESWGLWTLMWHVVSFSLLQSCYCYEAGNPQSWKMWVITLPRLDKKDDKCHSIFMICSQHLNTIQQQSVVSRKLVVQSSTPALALQSDLFVTHHRIQLHGSCLWRATGMVYSVCVSFNTFTLLDNTFVCTLLWYLKTGLQLGHSHSAHTEKHSLPCQPDCT